MAEKKYIVAARVSPGHVVWEEPQHVATGFANFAQGHALSATGTQPGIFASRASDLATALEMVSKLTHKEKFALFASLQSQLNIPPSISFQQSADQNDDEISLYDSSHFRAHDISGTLRRMEELKKISVQKSLFQSTDE